MKQRFLLLILLISGLVPLLNAEEASLKEAREKASALDEALKGVETGPLLPDLAKLINIEPELAQKALVEKQYRWSSLVLAEYLARKTKKELAPLLEADRDHDWLKEIEKAGLPWKELHEHLDHLHVETTFIAFDARIKS